VIARQALPAGRSSEKCGSVRPTGLGRCASSIARTPCHDCAVGGGPTAQRDWLSLLPNPALAEHARVRAESARNRVADKITVFAGSMTFVYIHIVWFGCWIGFGVEQYPYGLLTMIVSLEAIFLSTFVMISQNRADAKRQIVADPQWATVQDEDKQNQELLDLS
jgi:Protein of unknown function (DUF1003)